MSCYHPIKAYRTASGVEFVERAKNDNLGSVYLPCGQCIGCRMRRAADWQLRVMHEAAEHEDSCFVTLTYGNGQLPPNGSLSHRDFQLFMKRLRKWAGPVRFYMCGEYGPLNLRPHYHACLFGVAFRERREPLGKSASGALFYDQEDLRKLWGLGRVSVQDLTSETAGYCARYIMKKVLGKGADEAYRRTTSAGDVVDVVPEYAAMSLKPGIGARWFDRYGNGIYRHDYVVADGVKKVPPAYYDELLRRRNAEQYELVKFQREERARPHWREQWDDRLAQREAVHLARVSTLKRGLE